MRLVGKNTVNGINVTQYQRHPRIIELRMILLHGLFIAEYGDKFTVDFFKAWCDMNKINYTFIMSVINQKVRIKQMDITDKLRYRQEVIFTGHVYNEARDAVGARFLNLSRTFLYREKELFDPNIFVTKEWLDLLDLNVVICGVPQYNNEALRFIESLEHFLGVIGNVPLAKKKV